MTATYRHIGYITNTRHHAAPLVIGDFEVMKGWQGNPNGTDLEEIELPKGTIVGVDLELTAPDVYQASLDEVVLLVEPGNHHPLSESFTLDDLQPALEAPLADEAQWTIDVPSGALVVAIAYNATPEEGADTAGLSNFEEDRPRLPKAKPLEPVYRSEPKTHRSLAIVPVTPGRYEVAYGDTKDPFMKIVVRRAQDGR